MFCPFCGGGFGGGGIGFLFNLLFTLILLVGLGLLIWWVVRQAGAGRYAPPREPGTRRALDILDEKYAKGEISKEEYDERKKTLAG